MTANENNSASLSDDDIQDLKIIVDMIIPASDAHKIPGATDPEIFEDILTLATLHGDSIASAMKTLNALSGDKLGMAFAVLPVDQREAITDDFRDQNSAMAELLEALTVQGYYRNARIKGSLDMDVRPPFPGGFTLEQGDWSLLEDVRRRLPFHRDTNN